MFQKITHLLKWPPWLTFSLIFLLFFSISYTSLDPDFGWHLRSGELFVKQGIPKTDPFTYTASDFPWINHEPLNDILVYVLDFLGGYFFLAIAFALLWTLSFFIISRKAKIPPPLLFLAALAVAPYSGIRTLTWSFFFLSLLISALSANNLRKPLKVIFIALIFALWANLHGSFLIGLVYLAYTGFYNLFTKKGHVLDFLPIFLLSLLATLLNPYGFHIYEEIFRTLTDGSLRWTISEWGINIPIPMSPYLILFALSVASSIKTWRIRDYLGIENCFLLASLLTQRHWPLFVLVSLRPTTSRLTNFLSPLKKLSKTNQGLRRVLSFALILLSTLTLIGVYFILPASANRTAKMPDPAISYLKNNPCSGNLFNEYNDGGYLIWQLPEQKVYIDGRMPSWQFDDTNYMKNWLSIQDDPAFRAKEFEKHNIACALLFSHRTDFIEDLKSKGWRVVSETDSHTLLFESTLEDL